MFAVATPAARKSWNISEAARVSSGNIGKNATVSLVAGRVEIAVPRDVQVVHAVPLRERAERVAGLPEPTPPDYAAPEDQDHQNNQPRNRERKQDETRVNDDSARDGREAPDVI
jgi:hypothetical protein